MHKYKSLGHVDRPNCFYTSSSSLSSLPSYFHLNLTLILIFSLSLTSGIIDKQDGA